MPVTSAGLAHDAPTERVSSGIPDLDLMLEGSGFFRGSSVLISGMAGSGKSTVGAHFADAACRRGERCIYFAMEESSQQIIRNMKSVGLDLQKWVAKGLLQFSAKRPSLFGLETHLAAMHRDVMRFEPAVVVVDPLSALMGAGDADDVQAMVLRLVDFLKTRGVTTLFTSLTHGNVEHARTDVQISSLIDAWLLLYNKETDGEHNRQLYLIKSRGMAHSNQVREFLLTDRGIQLREVYIGPAGVLTGAARIQQEHKDNAAKLVRQQETERRRREVTHKRRQIAAQIEVLQAELAAEEAEAKLLSTEATVREERLSADRFDVTKSRNSDRKKKDRARHGQ
jgi:circadian clock protein KaiC